MIKTWQLATGSVVLGLALAAGAVTAAGPWDSGQRRAERERAAAQAPARGAAGPERGPGRPAPAPSAPAVLEALGPRSATAPGDGKPGELGQELGRLIDASGLGPLRTASVIDAATGRRLYARGDGRAMTPASTTKIATAAAALTALGPDHRIPTSVVASGASLTLVGGGDASLDRARLGALADRTARALRERAVGQGDVSGRRPVGPVRLAYDDSLYRGSAVHRIGPNGNLAPVTALMVDQARVDPRSSGSAERSNDPSDQAAEVFARLLADRGVKVKGSPAPGRPAKDARPLAKVASPPLSALVERMLTASDNDIAESLARQTALASGEPASFAGAGRAVRKRLAPLNLPLDGARITDGSGLDRRARLSARLLTTLLARAAEPARPELRPVLTGLPVSGFSGTLQDRYTPTSPAAGLIRAKTGTLTGVNTLAGTAVSPDGRLLTFAFLASRTPSPYEAQAALDHLASALVS